MTNEQLVTLIRAHDNEAENMLQLWKQNKGFIYTIAKKYISYAEIDDLEQEGFIGLCEAVRHYDDSKGASFIHYAAFWIQQTIQRYIDNCCGTVRIPVGAKEKVVRYKKIINEYRKWYGYEPTDGEMRCFLGVGKEALETIKSNLSVLNIRSMDEVIGGDNEDICLGDTIASDQNMEEDIIEQIDTAAMKKDLWSVVDALPDNYPDVLHCRFEQNMTMDAVGQCLGISKSQVRKYESKAINELRKPKNKAKYQDYYEHYLSMRPVRHVGLAEFNRTWTSSVEYAVMDGME